MLLSRARALAAGVVGRHPVVTGVPGTRSATALLTSGRGIHMPPGGFDEPLPPNFGRQQGKGELSHTNLRTRKQKRRLLKKQKQPLPLGALKERGQTASLAKIKRELLALGQRSEQMLKGPRQPTIRVVNGTGTGPASSSNHNSTGEAAPVPGSAAYAHRLSATRAAHELIDDAADGQDEDDEQMAGRGLARRGDHYHANEKTHPSTAVGTLLDQDESMSQKANAHSAVFALTTPDGSAAVEERHHRGEDRSTDSLMASAVESHWQDYRDGDAAADAAAAAMERRFAVSPQSNILGSDLDRLERDMLRDYHQQVRAQPPLDAVYAEFGAGRQGKRMLWEPSSSFEKLSAADFAANRASESIFGDSENRNLSPFHMYAEAYRESQADTRRAAMARAARETAKGINYTRPIPGETHDTVHRRDQDDLLPAEDNPHFPTSHDGGEEAGPDAQRRPTHTAPEALADDNGLGSSRDRVIEVDARRDYRPQLITTQPALTAPPPPLSSLNTATTDDAPRDGDDADESRILYDAYRQRPADTRLVEMRGADYWDNYDNRRAIEERAALRVDAFQQEKLQQGAMDTSEVEYSINKVRKETFLYFQAHPINEMIQEPFVRIRRVLPKGGAEGIYYNPFDPYQGELNFSPPRPDTHTPPSVAGGDAEALPGTELAGEHDEVTASTSAVSSTEGSPLSFHMDADIPVQDARRMAQELGLDLVRIGAVYSQKSDRRIVALCMLADHREHMRDLIKFKIQKLGVQPPPTKECVEVPFTGGIHPHAIRFKAVGVAKHLLHRHAIRLNLTKFGTPREGFPVFQSILDEVKRQCVRLKAFHKAGEIQANYDEIYCYLYPSTGRSPKTTVDHPTPAQVRAVRDFRVLENEKEIYFDDLQAKGSQRERLTYLTKLEKGTAWADKDEGMSLQRQRALKVMLGYLPKGNNELYAARGDVNIPAPFRSSHPTSVSSWSSPQESNLEQASRGAAALGKRAGMPISDMHDLGETPENPTQLDRFYYRVQGPALEVGEFKEALGLKDNRRKKPPFAPGFATLGMKNGGASEQPQWEATK